MIPHPYSILSFIWLQSSNLLDLRLALLESFNAPTPRLKAYVELGRRDLWKNIGKGEGRELTVVSAAIHANIRPRGLWCVKLLFL